MARDKRPGQGSLINPHRLGQSFLCGSARILHRRSPGEHNSRPRRPGEDSGRCKSIVRHCTPDVLNHPHSSIAVAVTVAVSGARIAKIGAGERRSEAASWSQGVDSNHRYTVLQTVALGRLATLGRRLCNMRRPAPLSGGLHRAAARPRAAFTPSRRPRAGPSRSPTRPARPPAASRRASSPHPCAA